MRFIVMHKVDAHMESGAPPSKEIVENMGKFIGEAMRSGVFKDGAGLHRSAKRVRLRYKGAEREMTKGPYAGDDERIANLVQVQVKELEDATAVADRIAGVLGDGEIEIGPVVEAWDLGIGVPEPEQPHPYKFLLVCKGDGATQNDAFDTLKKQLADEGVLVSSIALASEKDGVRLPAGARGSKRTWMDGPFAESKELIAGFSIIEVPSREAAIEWANRYAEILDGNEVDVRVTGA